MGTELYHKTLGLVGLGQIGTYVTKLAQGLAMQVIGYDPYLAPGVRGSWESRPWHWMSYSGGPISSRSIPR